MVSRVQRYFLEIRDFSKLIDLNLPENHKIILDDKKDFQLNKFFYKQIGIDHYWRDRLLWSDKEWFKYVSNKNLETHVLKNGDDLIGYYEQEYHPNLNEVELIKEIDETLTYELPKHLLGIIWKGKYKGQRQKWFIMRYLGTDDNININTAKPEFLEWKWIDLDIITEVVVDFKLEVYKKLKTKIREIIN